jgi:type I restriction enzyme S subunit
MDAQQFITDFRYIADAPGGIAQLRRTIYQLAITGSLTPRAISSHNSKALLEEVEIVRQRLIREKRYKRMIELESEAISIPPDVVLPSNWCWTRLLDVGEINPRNEGDDDDSASFIQSRIVAKVDNLMTLCDKLEYQHLARRNLQNLLRKSVLEAVTEATDSAELLRSWNRLFTKFESLFHAPADVSDLKGMILDLAVSGQLLPRKKRYDSTGFLLLSEIGVARTEWSQSCAGQEKKEANAMLAKLRTQQVVTPDSALPKHWAWGTILQISKCVVDCHNKTAPYVPHGIHLVRTTDVRNGRINLAGTRKISEETYIYWSRRLPPVAGDVFFTREAPMGEAGIVPEEARVCLGQRTMLIRLFPNLFNNQYLLHVIESPSFKRRMVAAAIGMTVKHLRVGGVQDLLVPVPPKAEQDEIVLQVATLFKFCDSLMAKLVSKLSVAEHMAAFSAATITGVSMEYPKDEMMTVPKTELVAPLRLGQTPEITARAPLATILARHNGELPAKDLWQRFGGSIDSFYAQLKTEIVNGWVAQPPVATMREISREKEIA